jgi:hypothetical protein
MNAMLADIETSALDAAVSNLQALGSNVRGGQFSAWQFRSSRILPSGANPIIIHWH